MIRIRLRDRAATSADATSYAANSFAPSAAGVRLFVAFATVIGAGTPNEPTASGTNGLSNAWTVVHSIVVGVYRLTIMTSTAASTTAGVVTMDLAGQTQTAAFRHIWEMANALSTPVVQVVEASGVGVTTLNFDSDPLGAFAHAENVTMVAHFVGASFPAVRQDDAQGTLLQQGEAITTTPEGGLATYYAAGEVNSPSLEGSSGTHLAIAMEVAVDPTTLPSSSGGHTLNRVRLGR